MVNKIFSKSKKILFSTQSSVLSAATVIMVMVVASRVLGLVRQRVLAHFFTPNELSLFFAAFRLPDLVFEVLVFGTFSSAFIPVFANVLKKSEKSAWEIASTVVNLGFTIFLIVGVVAVFFADSLYGFVAPGFSEEGRSVIVRLARILFAAQGFFVISYVLTAVLESSRRFLIPAIAPLFYNLGIILGTLFGARELGLLAPTIGVVIGACLHLAIQLPLAIKLGFRFRPKVRITPDVKKIGKLALPRIVEVSFLQVSKSVELFLSSLISTASYTYLYFGNTIQLLPVGLFGTSIAKAALPTLSRQADSPIEFRRTLLSALRQIIFLVAPIATLLIVLRIPLVRLIFGTDIFSWEATVQTGMVVSAFAVGIVFQSVTMLLARAFYALHDTKTPVVISLFSIIVQIAAAFLFVRVYGLPAWGLAAAFSLGSLIHAVLLFLFIRKRLVKRESKEGFKPILKMLLACVGEGGVMYFLLKIFDKSVWIKRLSFLGSIEGVSTIPFERFVLDTRYTVNLLVLTLFVISAGALTYLGLSLILKTKEMWDLIDLVKRVFVKRMVSPVPSKEPETLTPRPTDSNSP